MARRTTRTRKKADEPTADNAAEEGAGSTESASEENAVSDTGDAASAPAETPGGPPEASDEPVPAGHARARVLVAALSVPADTPTGIAKVMQHDTFVGLESFIDEMVELGRVERIDD